MLDLYLKGGAFMHPILLASVVTLTVVIERGWFFWQMQGEVQKAFELLSERLRSGDKDGAMRMAEKITGPIGVVLKEGLKHREEGPEIVQEAMAIRGEEVLQTVRQEIPRLGLDHARPPRNRRRTCRGISEGGRDARAGLPGTACLRDLGGTDHDRRGAFSCNSNTDCASLFPGEGGPSSVPDRTLRE